LNHPGQYDAVKQDDAEVERLEALRRRAAGADATAAREFATALQHALIPGGLVARRSEIGEPLAIDGLLADAQSALERAAHGAPDSEADLLIDKGRLLTAAKRWVPARDALLLSIERRPSTAAFLAIVKPQETELVPDEARFAMLCEQIAPLTRSAPPEAQLAGWEAHLDFVRAYVEYCGAESPDGTRMLYGDAKKIPATRIPKPYRAIYDCWISHASCGGAAARRGLPADFCDRELRGCVQGNAR
jgi:hypothetical protein